MQIKTGRITSLAAFIVEAMMVALILLILAEMCRKFILKSLAGW